MESVPTHVFEAVDDTLETLESKYDVTVALAVDRGSHAWGAAGPDSDYDVGVVFVPSDLRQYAHLRGPTETINHDDEIDVQGWDVRTFASLLADSNEGAIDVLRSPIRYRVAYDPADLTAYVERTYNPMELYHTWRGIATSNYRKYISHHLVRNDDKIVPIVDVLEDAYVVDADDGTMTIAADDERFTETQTKPTVKRNLTITRAAMSARYLQATGERDGHELPALEFERFLTEQAPAVFEAERIERARDLLECKRAGEGDATVGDVVGRDFAHPPREIDPAVHARDGPNIERLNEYIDGLIAAVQ